MNSEITNRNRNMRADGSTIQEPVIANKNPTNNITAFVNLVKGNLGVGIFAMGEAFKNSGLILGTVFTFILGFLNVHCQRILITQSERIRNEFNPDKPLDFGNTVEMAFEKGPISMRRFAPFMKLLVNVLIVVTECSFCAVFFHFIGKNMEKNTFESISNIGVHAYMAIVVIPIFIITTINNLKYIAYFSAIGNILIITCIGIIMYYACIDLPNPNTRKYIADYSQLPLYFGTTMYAFGGIGLVLPIRNEMEKPLEFKKRLGALNVGMSIVTVLLVIIGFLGYLKWGDEVQEILYWNLSAKKLIFVVLQCLLVINVVLTYPVHFYIPFEYAYDALFERKDSLILNYGMKLVLVLITYVLAEAIPNLGLFISYIGATNNTILAFIIPCMLDLMAAHTTHGTVPFWIGLKNCFILLLAIVGCYTNTYKIVRVIIKEMEI